MNALVLANFPIAAVIFAAMVGIPLWLTFKRPDRAPRYSPASTSLATAIPAPVTAAPVTPAPATGPARRAAATRVPAARQHAGRRHSTSGTRVQRDQVTA